ncbi:alpha/beta hydrolase [Enterococcus sp. AZ192]|uniref:alpha/beta hydrolase n=1 Tax=unclassified Enterococcus TaxID=2608891 RepID=UPI003D27B8D3
MKKILLGLLGLVVLIIVSIIIIFNISPKPTISLAKVILFKIPEDSRNKEYTEGNVNVRVNLNYDSTYKSNQFDLYTPIKPKEGNPIIAWVHGGGFIGGDKLEEKEYATKLAESGYSVAVMNYELVPDTQYPRPVIQTSEFVTYLANHSKEYSLNMDHLFLAGDSAGAQIASQFLATQTNDVYRKSLGIKQVVDAGQIKGALLYCGPYNMPEIVLNSSSPIVKFGFSGIGWGYFKEKDWSRSEQAKSSIVKNFVTDAFPPSYITDGNTSSFESQGKEFIKALESKKVPVSQRFFALSEYKTAHEYQFELDTEPGKTAFNDTIEFLSKYEQ